MLVITVATCEATAELWQCSQKEGYEHQADDIWYRISRLRVSYCEAMVDCNRDGARLATLKTAREFELFETAVESLDWYDDHYDRWWGGLNNPTKAVCLSKGHLDVNTTLPSCASRTVWNDGTSLSPETSLVSLLGQKT